ncbi:nitrite reductase small subunit NirD [Reichenbachiella agarivorans]|uniref:Nitrite reductase small subunit NirD n=1 Tax=Reichenbachiella agarivorans TaxID=2979464 RepID=A0ABY6CMU6_9BACT|nr:nitrite reductase small subunit NirD [Reichenbachiella agarivorans]UXP31833.1 nitrite reductase small subunit NirD [Reichenbachiella agarivorans]
MTQEIAEYKTVKAEDVTTWYKAASMEAFPDNGGAAIEYKGLQIAIFNFSRRKEWYASQNLCPHKKQMILSRGMLGSEGEEPKVACPFHKKTFSLKTGNNLNGDECDLATYPVKIQDGYVYVGFSH